MSSPRSRSGSGPVLNSYSTSFSRPFAASHSHAGRYGGGGGAAAGNGSYLATSSSSFSSSAFFNRSTSPTRVHFAGSAASPAASVRFSIDNRPTSPGRSISFVPAKKVISSPSNSRRKTCMCSPTTHPGSFRCSLHKGFGGQSHHHHHHQHAMSSSSSRLNARRSAMTNSLVRIGTVEGDLVKRALAALIRPSSHQQRRREAFQPRPSRLSVMSKADDL